MIHKCHFFFPFLAAASASAAAVAAASASALCQSTHHISSYIYRCNKSNQQHTKSTCSSDPCRHKNKHSHTLPFLACSSASRLASAACSSATRRASSSAARCRCRSSKAAASRCSASCSSANREPKNLTNQGEK